MKVRILIATPLPSMEKRDPRDKRPNFDVGAKLDREALGTACLVHGRKLGLVAPTVAIATDPSAACIEGAAALQRGFHPTNQWPGLPEVIIDSAIESGFDPFVGSDETVFKAFLARCASYGASGIVICSHNLIRWLEINYGKSMTNEGPMLVVADVNDELVVEKFTVDNLDGFSAERARSRVALSTPLGAADLAVRPLPPAPDAPDDAHYEEISIKRPPAVADPRQGTVVVTVAEALAAEGAPQA